MRSEQHLRGSSAVWRRSHCESRTNCSCKVTAPHGSVARLLHVFHSVLVGLRARRRARTSSARAARRGPRPDDEARRCSGPHLQRPRRWWRPPARPAEACPAPAPWLRGGPLHARSRGPAQAASSASLRSSGSSPRFTAIFPPGSAQALGTELFSTTNSYGSLPIRNGGELLPDLIHVRRELRQLLEIAALALPRRGVLRARRICSSAASETNWISRLPVTGFTPQAVSASTASAQPMSSNGYQTHGRTFRRYLLSEKRLSIAGRLRIRNRGNRAPGRPAIEGGSSFHH